MIKRLIASALLALITIPLIYCLSLSDDKQSLSFSIDVMICLGLSMLAALIIVIRYWIKRSLNIYWWMYIATLLAENLATLYLLSLPVNLFTFLFSPVALCTLLLISAMIVALLALDSRRSGSTPDNKS